MLLRLMEVTRATALQLRAGALTRVSPLRRSVHPILACQGTSSQSLSRLSPWIRNIVSFPILHMYVRGPRPSLCLYLISECVSQLLIIVRCLPPVQNLRSSRSQLVHTSSFSNVMSLAHATLPLFSHYLGLRGVCASYATPLRMLTGSSFVFRK